MASSSRKRLQFFLFNSVQGSSKVGFWSCLWLKRKTNILSATLGFGDLVMTAALRYLVQLHKDVPKAARFYSEGLGFTVDVCSLRWAELHSGPLKLALLQSPSPNRNQFEQKDYSSLLSFTVPDINSTVTKLMSLGAELDGPIKYEIHGKVAALRCIDGHVIGLYEPT